MRVVLVNSNYWPFARGGSESSVSAINSGLVLNNVDVKVFSLRPLFAKGVNSHIDDANVYVPLLNIYYPFVLKRRGWLIKAVWHGIDLFNFPMSFLAAYKLYKMRPDVVHTNNISGFGGFFLVVLKMFGLKVLHTPRDYFLIDQLGTLRRSGRNLSGGECLLKAVNFHKRYLSRLVDSVVYTSLFMRKVHEENGCFSNVDAVVIYNGCSTIDGYAYSNERKTCYTFGYVGRPGKEKGLDCLINIFSTNEVLLKHKLRIIGATQKEIAQLVSDDLTIADNIEFLGFAEDKSFYTKLDVVVVPSKWNEPFGRTCAEAMLLGIPVVVSNVGGLPEQIINSEVGRCFNSIEELQSTLVDICRGEIRFSPSRHIAAVKQLFSNESMCESYFKYYSRVANKHR